MKSHALALLALLAACGAPPAGQISSPPPPPPSNASCQVELVTHVLGDGAERAVKVTAHNLTDAPLDLELPGRCPAGPVDFTGLAPGYDYYGTCTMGACADDAPVTLHLDPGAIVDVAETRLALDGGSCNAAVAPGSYTLEPVVPALAVTTCVVGAPLVVDASASSGDPSACERDEDCVVYCPSAPGCCSSESCGCRGAIHAGRQDDADATYADRCERAPDCPAMGCAYEPARGAACRSGRCVATDEMF